MKSNTSWTPFSIGLCRSRFITPKKKLFVAIAVSSFFVLCVYNEAQHYENLNKVQEGSIFASQLVNNQMNAEDETDNLKRIELKANDVTTCSDEATAYGPGQKVISYSFYVNNNTNVTLYLPGIKPNLQSIPLLYPGWVARIYTDEVQLIQEAEPDLFTDYNFLFWCDVTKIPVLGDMRRMVAMTWRFLPLGDPLVDIFISRDLDSRLGSRERKAVEEWENSIYTLHAMRDHPKHEVPFLGGMWGAKNSVLGRERSKQLQSQMIKASVKVGGTSKGPDQVILEDLYRQQLSTETMAHDSYFCEHYPDKLNLGFPTQREGSSDFVGNVIGVPYSVGECPIHCRRHPDWTNC